MPASGSVTPNATCSLPSAARGRNSAFSRSLPNRMTGLRPKMVRCNALHPFIPAPLAATSFSTSAASVMPWPPPACSGGMAIPTHPPSAISW